MFPVIEIIRPMRIKKAFMDRWTALNFVAIAATDFLIWWLCGLTGLAYVVLSTIFGVGLHVVGARWVQEITLSSRVLQEAHIDSDSILSNRF
jgi:hypothetical protein